MHRLTHPYCNALASAILVMLVFGTAPGTAFSQDAMGSAVRDWERRSVQAVRAHAEQRARMEQSRAHAQMPDTMYASTPDPSPPPHPFPLDVTLKSAPERSAAKVPKSARAHRGSSVRTTSMPYAPKVTPMRGETQLRHQGFPVSKH